MDEENEGIDTTEYYSAVNKKISDMRSKMDGTEILTCRLCPSFSLKRCFRTQPVCQAGALLRPFPGSVIPTKLYLMLEFIKGLKTQIRGK